MRGKVAKRLRRIARGIAEGRSPEEQKKLGKKFKKMYKSHKQNQ